ncbi:MAG: hypothetical protein ACI8VW_000778 [bacterium]|jgi:hypothetical protein
MGTLFRIFPQTSTAAVSMPAEIVEVSSPAGSVGPGPSDDRMFVIFPVDKAKEYGMHEDDQGRPFVFLPPWHGAIHEPAFPDANGDFLHYDDVDDPRFQAAHTYACIRFTLDVWERYYGRPIEWYFRDHYSQAEVVILPDFENAQIGRGFIEIGTDVNKVTGKRSPFTLNFDVIAHEVGHGILFSVAGEPDVEHDSAEFLGFQESGGDVISMIAILHFDSVIDEVLGSTSGNLYMANHLNRFAETSQFDQIRMASNNTKLSDFSNGWKSAHKLAQPLTGAIFDIFVDIFHEELVRMGAISTTLESMSDNLEGDPSYAATLQTEFDAAYQSHSGLFKEALVNTRDIVAVLMVETWCRLSTEGLKYTHIHYALQDTDRAVFGGIYRNIIDVNFKWRHIGTATVGPRLPKDKNDSDGHSHGHGHSHSNHSQEAGIVGGTESGSKSDSHSHSGFEPVSETRMSETADHFLDAKFGVNVSLRSKKRRKKSYAQRYRESRVRNFRSSSNH